MGNEIVGGKVHAHEVIDGTISVTKPDFLALKHPDVLSVNVLTGAQACKQGQEVDLSDSLFASVLTNDKLPPTGESVNCPSSEPENVTDCWCSRFHSDTDL